MPPSPSSKKSDSTLPKQMNMLSELVSGWSRPSWQWFRYILRKWENSNNPIQCRLNCPLPTTQCHMTSLDLA